MHPTLKKGIAYAGYPLLVAWPLVVLLGGLSAFPLSADPIIHKVQELVLFLTSALPVIGAVVFLERRMGAQPEQKPSAADLRCDAISLAMCVAVVSPLAQQLVRLLALGVAGSIAAVAGSKLWPTDWPLAAQLLLALVVTEFCTYWFHRVSHLTNLGWRLHATHHGTNQVYWLNSTRFHALELTVRTACQVGPLILLGCPPETFLVYGVFTISHGWIQHSNVNFHSGVLDFFLATPRNHRWHHSTVLAEANNNYGVILTLWDHVFGSYYSPRDRAFTGTVGIGELPNFPTTYLGQFLSPFAWERLLQSQPAAAKKADVPLASRDVAA
jgi:ornithine lipid hydroxylase